MVPDLSLLLALILGLAAMDAQGAAPEEPVLLGIGLTVFLTILMVRGVARRAQAAVAQGQAELAKGALLWTGGWSLVGWFFVLEGWSWAPYVEAQVGGGWWMAQPLLFFAPGALMFAESWRAKARIEASILAAAGLPREGALESPVRRGLRRNALALVPVTVLLACIDGLRIAAESSVPWLREPARWIQAMPMFSLAFMVAVMLVIIWFLPAFAARVLRLRPLPAGPLRDRLEHAAKRIGLRYREMMMWPTGGRMPNAFVVGLSGHTRRIVFTDRLLDELPADELLAVFFHEAGHAKRHHVLLLMLGVLSVLLLFAGSVEFLTALGVPQIAIIVVELAILWFVLMGFVNRRFEREADLYGATHAAILDPAPAPRPDDASASILPRGAALMIRALERTHRLARGAGSHQHGTLEQRTGWIRAQALDPGVREAFHRGQRWLMLGLVGLFVAAAAWTVSRYPEDMATARATMAFEEAEVQWGDARDADKRSDPTAAKRAWEASYAAFARAAAHLEGQDSLVAKARRAAALGAAGQIAFAELDDAERAKPLLDEALALTEDDPRTDDVDVLRRRMELRVELGRVRARVDGNEDAARRLLRRASRSPLLGADPDALVPAPERNYLSDRLRLLEAECNARYGGEAGLIDAQATLGELITSSNPSDEAARLRRDARRELDRLERETDPIR